MNTLTEAGSDWLTVTEAAAEIGVSEKTLRKRINAGTIPAQKVTLPAGGVAWRVARSALTGNVGPVPRLEVVGTPILPDKESKSSDHELKRNGEEGNGTPSVGTDPHREGRLSEGFPSAVGSASHREGSVLERNGTGMEGTITVPQSEFEALRTEVNQLRGALLGGALQAIDARLQRLDNLPDAEALRTLWAESQEQNAQLVAEAVRDGIEAAVKESDAASRDDIAKLAQQLAQMQQENAERLARIEAENQALRDEITQERAADKRGLFERLFRRGS